MKKVVIFLFAFLFIFACKQNNDSSINNKDINNKEKKAKIEDKIKIEDEYGMLLVPVPQEGLIGSPMNCIPCGTEENLKGVLVEGRNVKLSPYRIAKHETTYKLWKEIYDWAIGRGYQFTKDVGRAGSNIGGDEMEPVTMVSWRDAIVWCNAYTEKIFDSQDECVYRKGEDDNTVLRDAKDEEAMDKAYFDKAKKGFRLPTEAEWEAAARYSKDEKNSTKCGNIFLTKINSVSGASMPIGFEGLEKEDNVSWEDLRDEAANYAVFSKWWNGSELKDQDPPVDKTAVVGSKKANALGAFDMSGNVFEWCFDHYGYIKPGEATNPDKYDENVGSGGKVTRGGSYVDDATYSCLGFRSGYDGPHVKERFIGFRIARYEK